VTSTPDWVAQEMQSSGPQLKNSLEGLRFIIFLPFLLCSGGQKHVEAGTRGQRLTEGREEPWRAGPSLHPKVTHPPETSSPERTSPAAAWTRTVHGKDWGSTGVVLGWSRLLWLACWGCGP